MITHGSRKSIRFAFPDPLWSKDTFGTTGGQEQTVKSEKAMLAARLYGPRDLRLDRIPQAEFPERGEVRLRTMITCICGSDLHAYNDNRLGDTDIQTPLVLGHEFSAVVETVGAEALDGTGASLQAGQRVAVDPAVSCEACEFCRKGHPNLCNRLTFCGLWPEDGSLQEFKTVPARSCFPVPGSLDDVQTALLEPLGVALHAVELSALKIEESVAILGAGPIGLLVLEIVRESGAHPIIVSERLSWRLERARHLGATTVINAARQDVAVAILDATGGRGADVVFEAAWAQETVDQAVRAACPGGRVVVVGIPSDDRMSMRASTARRKGLTIRLCRRMKHAYPRAIAVAVRGAVDLAGLVTHHCPLSCAAEAFAFNAGYSHPLGKVVIHTGVLH